jgi:hypothetical protein
MPADEERRTTMDDGERLDRDERHEEERRPVEEAGGGESEGFEETEREVIEGSGTRQPGRPPGQPLGDEEDPGEAGVEYGEADGQHEAD